ncbi:MAG: hypothetical protein H0U28_10175 [Nocardioidaceae bacterium]|nr:hypothetical protein [Nocardioidaceae bacterium]
MLLRAILLAAVLRRALLLAAVLRRAAVLLTAVLLASARGPMLPSRGTCRGFPATPNDGRLVIAGRLIV